MEAVFQVIGIIASVFMVLALLVVAVERATGGSREPDDSPIDWMEPARDDCPKTHLAQALAEPVADGWTPHDGGPCPVPAGTLVDVRCRNGYDIEKVAVITSLSGSDWTHTGHAGDIIAYRLHQLDEPAEPAAETGIPASEPAIAEAPTESAFTLPPDWSQAPEWAMWAAQDEDGDVAWFEKRPIQGRSMCWWSQSNVTHTRKTLRPRGPYNPNWRNAIEERPATVSQPDEGHDGLTVMEYAELSPAAVNMEGSRPFHGFGPTTAAIFNSPILTTMPTEEAARLIAIESAARTYHKTGSATAHKRLGKALGVQK